MESHPTRDEIIAEIIRIQEEIGVYRGRSEFENYSEFSRDDILRHFDWYSEAIKTARSATSTTTEVSDAAESRAAEYTSDSSSPDDGSRADSPEEKQVEQEDEGSREDEVGEEHTGNEAGASDQPNSTKENTGNKATGPGNQRSIIVRITDDGTPLSSAEVTVNNSDGSGGQTDKNGDVEIQLPEDLDQVPVHITHYRWADKNLDTTSGGDARPYQLDVSPSEWDSDITDADTSSDSEGENEASDIISTILADLDQLDKN
jgi:hypothetical protein